MEDEDTLLSAEDFSEDEYAETLGGTEAEAETDELESASEETDENAKTQEEETEDDEKSQKRDLKKDASFAEKRREKERLEREQREAKIKEEAKIEGKLSVLKTNPYTNEKIEDDEDLKIYEIQKTLDDEGLDPISDLPKRLAELERNKKKAEKAQAEEQEKINVSLKKDIENFKKAYPDVDTKKLASDNEYLEFAKGKIGRWTTQEIYEAYQAKKEKSSAKEKKAMVEKEADDVSKKITKNPSSTPSGTLPPKTVENMTKEEFKTYWKEKYGE